MIEPLDPRVPATVSGHLLRFYDEDTLLGESVAHFVDAGRAQGQASIVIATAAHFRELCKRLAARGVDVAHELDVGTLIYKDANETLESLLRNGVPHAPTFDELTSTLLNAAAGPGGERAVRVFGEMVDLLCRSGRPELALELERLWTGLGRRRRFTLLCGYQLDSLAHADDRLVARLCAEHDEASFPEALSAPGHERLREISQSERRRKEAEGFRLLVESVRDYAIYMLDPRGIVTTWNAGAERIKGYKASEVIGSHCSRFYPASEITAGKCEHELTMASTEGRFEDEGYRLRKDGSAFWANVVITALRDEDGTLIGFAKVTRDLTERKKAEEARILLAQAQETNRVKDEFLAMISHELRTPLSSILGWATLLGDRTSDPAVAKGIETIRRNAQAQARIIEDVLDVARIASGKLGIEMRSVNFAAIVRAVVEETRPSAAAKGIDLNLSATSDIVPLDGDPTRLQQIIWNLLTNALKFTPRGGVVDVDLVREGSQATFRVRDTGIGIEPSFLPHVFERFRQADASTSRRAGGLGLGLAIVRHLVELHGGTITAESPGHGEGATFTISLPLSAAAHDDQSATRHARPDPSRSDPMRPLSGLRVLVVEDEADARELMGILLEERGALVTLCGSAPEVYSTLDHVLPDVIVSDIGLPGQDGYELARSLRLRPQKLGGSTPIVAVTAYASAQDKRRAIEAGCDHHLAKPVDSDELVMLVEQLARSRAS